MHRGCVPFINPRQFESHYWPTLRPIIEEFWKHGHQTMFYAEGKWAAHLDTFTELPARSILFHCDRDDVFAVRRKLGHKFAVSGGIPNVLLSYGKPAEVESFCKRLIDEVAPDGGYIFDAGAIMQDDTSIENLRVMTDTARRYGEYRGVTAPSTATPPCDVPASVAERAALKGLTGWPKPNVPPGICFPWEQKVKELPEISGDKEMLRRVWEQVDGLGNMFIWQILLSF
jgi:hypothetical protein